MYFNSPVKYMIAGKYLKIKFSTVTYFKKPVESKTQFTKYSINVNCDKQQIFESKTQFTKYSINVNCDKQQIYRFGPGLNFNVKYLH